MNFNLTEDQNAFAQTAKQFAEHELSPEGLECSEFGYGQRDFSSIFEMFNQI